MNLPTFMNKTAYFSPSARNIHLFLFHFSVNGMPFVCYLINKAVLGMVHGNFPFLFNLPQNV